MDKSIENILFLEEHIIQVLASFKNKNCNHTEHLVFGLLNRMLHSIASLKILLPEYTNNSHLEYSIGILIRSILLDTLISIQLQEIYISANEEGKSDEYIQNILLHHSQQILSDGLANTLRYIEVINKHKALTREELINGYSKIVKKFPEFFDEYKSDGTPPVVKGGKKSHFSPFGIFKSLMENKKTQGLARIYDSYLFFSKYEHFNILYYDFMLDTEANKKDRIERCIEDFYIHVFCLLLILSNANNNNSIYAPIAQKILNKGKELDSIRRKK